jgi:hypothetical protein
LEGWGWEDKGETMDAKEKGCFRVALVLEAEAEAEAEAEEEAEEKSWGRPTSTHMLCVCVRLE